MAFLTVLADVGCGIWAAIGRPWWVYLLNIVLLFVASSCVGTSTVQSLNTGRGRIFSIGNLFGLALAVGVLWQRWYVGLIWLVVVTVASVRQVTTGDPREDGPGRSRMVRMPPEYYGEAFAEAVQRVFVPRHRHLVAAVRDACGDQDPTFDEERVEQGLLTLDAFTALAVGEARGLTDDGLFEIALLGRFATRLGAAFRGEPREVLFHRIRSATDGYRPVLSAALADPNGAAPQDFGKAAAREIFGQRAASNPLCAELTSDYFVRNFAALIDVFDSGI